MIEFDAAAHRYTVNGRELPSVTHVCRFLSVDVAANARPWLRDMAADRGTRVHAYTVMLDYGEEPEEVEPDCAGYLEAYRRFLRDFRPKWAGIETVLGSEVLGYAGTCDRHGTVRIANKRTPCILDIKTGAELHHAATAAQLQGYSHLLNRPQSDPPALLLALHLRRDGTYALYDETDTAPHLFLNCMVLHRAMKNKGVSL